MHVKPWVFVTRPGGCDDQLYHQILSVGLTSLHQTVLNLHCSISEPPALLAQFRLRLSSEPTSVMPARIESLTCWRWLTSAVALLDVQTGCSAS